MSLGGLAPEEAVELLCCYRKPHNREDQKAAEAIVGDLDYHPLAVVVCSRALEADTGLRSFMEFREALDDSREDELELASELEGVLPNGHEKSVAATLLRSIKNLKPEGQDLLRIAASVAAAPIPPSLVAATFAEADGLSESDSRHRARLARSQVENASLAERAEENGILVHNLVSRTMRFHDRDRARWEQLRLALIQVLNIILPDVADIRTHKSLELQVLHARELCVAEINDADTAELGDWVARHDLEEGAYVTSRSLHERVLEVRRRILGEEHPDTLTSMGNLAETLSSQGDLAGARSLQERVLEVRRRILGEEHPDTSVSEWNLLGTLLQSGDVQRSISLVEALSWLLERDPETLGAAHQQIRRGLEELLNR